MGLVVNTNVAAMIAQRNLGQNTRNVTQSLERLASGLRINSAKDDAAGLHISEVLRTQIRGNEKALQNAQDGNSMLQVAEGSFTSITENIQRIRELTVQAANDTYGSNERRAIAQEVLQRFEDIDRIALSTKFNGVTLLNGSNADGFVLQIGANNVANVDTLQLSSAFVTANTTAIGLSNHRTTSITAAAGGIFESGDNCRTFLTQIDGALTEMLSRRSTLGAFQNRLDAIISSLEITNENLSASESRIRDLDIAKETSTLTRNQVLQQAATSVLAQANQIPALALNLI